MEGYLVQVSGPLSGARKPPKQNVSVLGGKREPLTAAPRWPWPGVWVAVWALPAGAARAPHEL